LERVEILSTSFAQSRWDASSAGAGQPSLLADARYAMACARDVLERGHDAQLRQPSQPGIVHYSAADAASSAGLLPSLMRIERPIYLLSATPIERCNSIATRAAELLWVSFQVSVKVILRQSRYDWEALQSC
jgi:hypothetical protein